MVFFLWIDAVSVFPDKPPLIFSVNTKKNKDQKGLFKCRKIFMTLYLLP